MAEHETRSHCECMNGRLLHSPECERECNILHSHSARMHSVQEAPPVVDHHHHWWCLAGKKLHQAGAAVLIGARALRPFRKFCNFFSCTRCSAPPPPAMQYGTCQCHAMHLRVSAGCDAGCDAQDAALWLQSLALRPDYSSRGPESLVSLTPCRGGREVWTSDVGHSTSGYYGVKG